MFFTFLTALFFPDYGSEGVPWDLYLVHVAYFAIVIPFHVIFFSARAKERQNTDAAPFQKVDNGSSNSQQIEVKETKYPDNFPRAI